MPAIEKLLHLLIPRESNNQKAKILHTSSLAVLAVFLITFQVALSFLSKSLPRVLGYAANISPSEVVRLTNEKRSQNGLAPLTENSTLSSAALAKGNDMLAKGYWAHFAPDGTSPWSFITSFGYKYRYAGENLARDFNNPASAVEAWMNSPTHRDNILNSRYREVGIGVVEGSLAGVDTTIIVQFFGTQTGSVAAISEVKANENTTSPATVKPAPTVVPAKILPSIEPTQTPSPTPAPVVSTSRISPFASTKNISMGIVGVLLLVLSIDLIVVRRKRIARIGGRTLAHLAYFGMILAVIIILKAGEII